MAGRRKEDSEIYDWRLTIDGGSTFRSVLATGALFRNTCAYRRAGAARVSVSHGTVDNPGSCEALERSARELVREFGVPDVVAHDLHPDFFSTILALRLAREWGIPARAVQHHHAHIAAVMAMNDLEEPVVGLALDGVGLGTDGTAWGGELLLVEPGRCERLGHLAPLSMPGGDRAAGEPWRMAAAVLHRLGQGPEIARRFPGPGAAIVTEMLEKNMNCPTTTSLGRLFDAAAGLMGISSAPGEIPAAVLETAAFGHGAVSAREDGFAVSDDGVLDFLPLFELLSTEKNPGRGAALFHATVARGLSEWAARAARERRCGKIVFGGGCFLNNILLRETRRLLESPAFDLGVFEAGGLPPGDESVSLGQAVVAATSLV